MEGKRKAPIRPGLNIPKRSAAPVHQTPAKPVANSPVSRIKPSIARLKPQAVKRPVPKLDTLKSAEKASEKKLSRRERWALRRAEKAATARARQASLKKLQSDNWLEDAAVRRAAPMRPGEQDIGAIWKGQERIRSEEEALRREYEAAKEKSRRLKKRIKEQNREGDSLSLKGVLAPEVYDKVAVTTEQAKKVAHVSATRVKPVVARGVHQTKQLAARARRISPRTYVSLGAVVLAAGLITGGTYAWRQRKHTKVEGVTTTQIEQSNEPPAFDPTVPRSADKESLKYNQQGKVYTFKDTFQDVDLIVTEQLLPPALVSNPAGLVEIAKSVGATEMAQVDDTQFYIATTDDPLGVGQRVVFMTDELLVFVTAPSRFDGATWAGYIAAFKAN